MNKSMSKEQLAVRKQIKQIKRLEKLIEIFIKKEITNGGKQ